MKWYVAPRVITAVRRGDIIVTPMGSRWLTLSDPYLEAADGPRIYYVRVTDLDRADESDCRISYFGTTKVLVQCPAIFATRVLEKRKP